MPDYVALRVKIGLDDQTGYQRYPAFNSLRAVQDSGLDWSRYVDRFGEGWLYDKVSGHADDDADSPKGQQWGVLLVPKPFADQAVAAFPDDCNKLTEAECRDFHDNRACIHLDDEDRDEGVLSAMSSEMSMLNEATKGRSKPGLEARKAALLDKMDRALDPNDPSPGVRKNPLRRWADRKARRGITIVQ